MAKGLLVAGFNYSMVDAAEFNDWYDTEHVPERQRCKGFINCVRWQSVADARWRLPPMTWSRTACCMHRPISQLGARTCRRGASA